MQLGPNDWPKFQQQLKKLHLTEICQTETQVKQKEPKISTYIFAPKVFTENSKSSMETNTVKRRSHRSLIYPPITKIDHSGKCMSQIQNQKPNRF